MISKNLFVLITSKNNPRRKNMKKAFKVAAVITGFAAFGLLNGCGSDSTSTPATGVVAKGPVNGSRIQFGSAAAITLHTYSSTRTNASGSFAYKAFGQAITSTGGTYVDVVTGLEVAAPTLKAPAGASNVTPITTLVASAATPAIANSLIAELQKMGVSFDAAYLTVPTTANAKTFLALNESIGKMLATASAADVITLAANINTLLVANPLSSAVTATDIATFITANAAAIANGCVNVSAAQVTTAATYATKVGTLTGGSTLPTATGSGSGSGTGTGGTTVVQ